MSASYICDYVDSKSAAVAVERSSKPYHSNKELEVKLLKDAFVLPPQHNDNGTKKPNGGVVCDDVYYEYSYLHRGVNSRYDFDASTAVYRDEEVVYLGCFYNVWGHSITDCLKLLWFLQDQRYAELKKLKLVYISLNNGNKLIGNFLQMLKKLGIQESDIEEVKQLTKFRTLYLPDDCYYFDEEKDIYRYTDAYISMIDTISSNVKPAGVEKVFFSRSKIKGFKDMGEQYIERAFKEAGYSIYSPERLTLDEQIALLKDCKVFAAPQGSIAHNSLFMNPIGNVVIVRKAAFYTGYQFAINDARSHNVTYIDSHKSTMVNKRLRYEGPFFVYASHNLCKYLGIKDKAFPLAAYIRYMFFGLIKKLLRK